MEPGVTRSRAAAVVARLCLLWPLVILISLEMALRITYVLDGYEPYALLLPWPAWFIGGHRFGYGYMRALAFWLSCGIALSSVCMVAVKQSRLRWMILAGTIVDVIGIISAWRCGFEWA